jgi:putative endonuclease
VSEDRRRALGRRGEQLAAAHLRARGCAVIARNVRTRSGEIDIVARDGATLVFVEVKTRRVGASQRTLRAHQLPLAGLGAPQRARLRRLAAAWLRETHARRSADAIRFDAIGIVLDTRGAVRLIEHVESAW